MEDRGAARRVFAIYKERRVESRSDVLLGAALGALGGFGVGRLAGDAMFQSHGAGGVIDATARAVGTARSTRLALVCALACGAAVSSFVAQDLRVALDPSALGAAGVPAPLVQACGRGDLGGTARWVVGSNLHAPAGQQGTGQGGGGKDGVR